jgi:hypothetical protein
MRSDKWAVVGRLQALLVLTLTLTLILALSALPIVPSKAMGRALPLPLHLPL